MYLSHKAPSRAKIQAASYTCTPATRAATLPLAPSRRTALALLASAYQARQRAASTGSPAAWLRCAVESRRAIVAASRLEPSHWLDLLIDDADTMLGRAVQHVCWSRSRTSGVAS